MMIFVISLFPDCFWSRALIKYAIIISLIFFIIAPQLSRADTLNFYLPDNDINKSGYLYTDAEKINPDVLNQSKETESPLRRFEVTFFISLPFVFIANFLTLHVYEVVRQKSFNVSVWKEHKILLPVSTGVITSAVAFRAAYIGAGSSQREGAVYPGDRAFFFCAVKNY